MRPRLTRWDWPLAWAAFLLHNGEEVWSGLPAWSEAHAQLGWMAQLMPEGRFIASVIGLSLLVTVLAGIGTWRPSRWVALLLRIFAGIMLLNAISHIALSFWTGSIMPGVWTSILLLLPVMGRIVLAR